MEITEEKLIELFEKHFNIQKQELLSILGQKIDDLQKELKDTQQTLNVAYELSAKNECNIQELKTDIINLKETTTNQSNEIQILKDSNANKSEEIDNLKSLNKKTRIKLDDQVNRSLRKSLIFRGIKGDDTEIWEETRRKLNFIIGQHLPRMKNSTVVERAHHGKYYNNSTSTPIFACFYDWNDSQEILEKFSRNKIEGIHCEQMYSSEITSRRNLALLKRKELKARGDIVSGYIAYPATLVVKKMGESKYSTHSEPKHEHENI